jgi:hypothetical protein
MAAHDYVTIWAKFVGEEWLAERRNQQEIRQQQMMKSTQTTWRRRS